MTDCCHPVPPAKPETPPASAGPACHDSDTGHSVDMLFWGSLLVIVVLYAYALVGGDGLAHGNGELQHGVVSVISLAYHVEEMVNTVWWGILLGILMVSLLAVVPREFVMAALGSERGIKGVLRATAAGVLLDLCSHGILMVGARLYERGASIGQVMAFLIASPWNSFSLTLVLVTMIGLSWTLVFVALSMLIAVVVGVLFDWLAEKNTLPPNPHRSELSANFKFWPQARQQWRAAEFTAGAAGRLLWQGMKDSRMVLRWLLLGIVLASVIRAFVSTEHLTYYFGASLLGLLLTMLAATLIEVCSEGSAPMAADLVTRASAPGNGFAFLMAGVATDYTEVMVVKETTRSWKIALFMPLLTLPQVFVVAWLLNTVGQ